MAVPSVEAQLDRLRRFNRCARYSLIEILSDGRGVWIVRWCVSRDVLASGKDLAAALSDALDKADRQQETSL